MSALSTVQSPLIGRAHQVTITPAALAGCLGAAALSLVLIHMGFMLIRFVAGHEFVYGLAPLFDLDRERNVPAFFSTFNLLGASFLLGVIARFQWREQAAGRWHWFGLALGFLFMAFDEAACFHELLTRPSRELLDEAVAPVATVAWVALAVPLVAALGLAYLPFLWRLPVKFRGMFAAAGLMFVGGAVGMEVLDGLWLEVHGSDNLTYTLLIAVEEGLEMMGVIFFIHALLCFIRDHYPEVRLRFGEAS